MFAARTTFRVALPDAINGALRAAEILAPGRTR
jgi:hypothetical protein